MKPELNFSRAVFRVAMMLLACWMCFSGTESSADEKRPNIIFILSDDHRFDFMSFVEGAPKFLETPNLDRIAAEGAHLKNAFVTTSLCSPSRASILTGQFMHRHRVVDNQRAVPEGTVFYPQYLQKAGYETAMIGKWHMGHDNDEPRPGFDHWISFAGQGDYFDPLLNTNGEQAQEKGYLTDILTGKALKWLSGEGRDKEVPFFLHLSFKAVHYPFQPAPRNLGRYEDEPIDYPETMANTEENTANMSRWMRERRYGIHGIDHMETGAFDKDPVPDFDDLYHRYAENVFGVDENVGRVLEALKKEGLLENTIVFYMGDNGFHLGEHGFYDKRDAFEPSIRVPLIAYAPGRIKGGTVVEQMVQNIDIAPTALDFAGVSMPEKPTMDGKSFRPLLEGKEIPWRKHILYEYHWEWNFPATPTLFAIRTDRYKFIYYHGLWDHNGFYDLETDPHERHNLINVPAFAEQIGKLQEQMFDELEAAGALEIPIRRPKGEPLHDRKMRR